MGSVSPVAGLLANRVQLLKASPILMLAARANEMKAAGKNVISLSIGEPDWDTYENIKEVAIGSIRVGLTKYSPPAGIPELRKAVAEQTTADLGLPFDMNNVTVTSGAKFILFSAMNIVLNPGDEMLVVAPYWTSYTSMIEMAGGVPKVVNTSPENGLKLTAQQLRASLTPKTKALLLNSPSNPTGVVYSADELRALAEVIRSNPRLVVMSDDIYNRLVFDLKDSERVCSHLLHVAPDLRDRVIAINGASKSYAMTGWRIGWACAHPDIIKAMSSYQSQTVSCACTVSQYATVEAIQNSAKNVEETRSVLKQRRDFITELLETIPNVRVIKPEGAFYLWVDIGRYLGKSFSGQRMQTSIDISNALLIEKLVAVVPGIEFGMEGYLRLSFALDNTKAKEAVERMKHFFEQCG